MLRFGGLVAITLAANFAVFEALTFSKGDNGLSSDVGKQVDEIDCYTRLPVGKTKEEAETKTRPSIGFTIGNVRVGQVKYVPGQPLSVIINHYGGGIRSIFVKAETLFGSVPVGTWVPSQTDDATTKNCGSDEDNSLLVRSINKPGLISATWTPDLDLSGYVEFQLTVIAENGKFWLWNSFLTENA